MFWYSDRIIKQPSNAKRSLAFSEPETKKSMTGNVKETQANMQAGSVLVSGRISSELSNNWPSILLSQVSKQTLSSLQQSSQSCRLGHLDSNMQKLWNGELVGPKCDTKLHSLLSAQSCLHSSTVSMSGRLWIRLLLWTSQAWSTEQVVEGRAGLPRAEPASSARTQEAF